jgi:SAM-dependent methyltransferase
VQEGDLKGQRVLDVGCGTGRFVAALAAEARVWGVDPAPEMLAVARSRAPRGVGFKVGSAEALPFKDNWFDRAVLWLVVHLVARRPAFAELYRVLRPAGRLVVATFDPAHFDEFWLNRLFPSLEAIDRARFPQPEELVAELAGAGFTRTRLLQLRQRATLDRESALKKIRGRHISTFDLLEEHEYDEGSRRAERELPARIDQALEWVLAVAER